MKKLIGTCAFIFFLLFQMPGLSFADSDLPFPLADNALVDKQGEPLPSVQTRYDVQIKSDSFGGTLYSYVDSDGNECVTNRKYLINHENVFAKASEDDPASREPVFAQKTGNIDILYVASDDFQEFDDEDISYEEQRLDAIPDPFEPVNRLFFQFNDKLYFWFLKPVAQGYSAVVPEPARKGISNFFYNLGFPIRFVNCLLQLKIESAGNELSRFLVNSIIGMAGLFNPAEQCGLTTQDEDFGQSLGSYGVTPGFFINWPILGPSSVRGTLGMLSDSLLDPINYLDTSTKYIIAIKGLDKVNETSFYIGDYEDLKKSALDPYVSFRNSYYQYRQGKIKE